MKLEFCQVDAFSSRPLFGNPCALFFGADAVTDEQMQAIARETNLSETVFFQTPTDPDADYKVRIFTPRTELPFAGHPTIASAHGFLEAGGKLPGGAHPVLHQQCGIGLVPVEVSGAGSNRRLTMTQATPEFSASHLDRAAAAALLNCRPDEIGGTPAEIVSTGIPWLVVRLASHERLARLSIDHAAFAPYCEAHGNVGLSVFALGSSEPGCDVKVRAFARGAGVPEDPVTGSANGCIAAYVVRHQLMGGAEARYVAEQGTELQRNGRVHVDCETRGGTIVVRIGGEAVTVSSGVMTL